jgi:hypothetical protein
MGMACREHMEMKNEYKDLVGSPEWMGSFRKHRLGGGIIRIHPWLAM